MACNILTSGHVKVFMLHADGREKTLDILSEGDILGEMTLFGSELRSATVETLEETTFIVISKEDFQLLIMEIPKLAIHVIEMLSERLRQANQLSRYRSLPFLMHAAGSSEFTITR
jgi:CRP/FNR family transcriptional regulator